MAKFNIEVSLDWLEEDGTIDETLKEEIVSQVTNKITAQTTERIQQKIDVLVADKANQAEQIIGEKLNSLMDDFMNKPRTVTDRWGDVIKTNISVIDTLKEACDNFIEGSVDENGKAISGSYYGKSKKRIDYIIEKQIDYKMKNSIESAAKEIQKGLQKYIDETLKSQIGENVAKIIGLDKITQKIEVSK